MWWPWKQELADRASEQTGEMGQLDFERSLCQVLEFLKQEGLTSTQEQLLLELQAKAGSLPSLQPGPEGATARTTSAEPELLPGSPDLPGDLPIANAGTSSCASPRPILDLELEHTLEAAVPVAQQAEAHAATLQGKASLASPAPTYTQQTVPWDEAVNEYETRDDIGYERKEVSGQQQFIDLELLDVQSEQERDGVPPSSDQLNNDSNKSPGQITGASADFSDDDDDSTCGGSSISGAVIDLMPGTSMPMQLAGTSSGGTTGACSSSRPSKDGITLVVETEEHDAAWDKGPIGIRIAEPVTTPTKTSSVCNADETKPVLSRVESLSSSFKDFDIECNDEDPSRKDNPGLGGFSFPVAAPAAEAQPDHKLFKSWPSVRSSCTSEVIADDDHVVADYADDEYLRSVSKPTSRSTSQNLGDLSKGSHRPSDDELGHDQSGFEEWSFAQPKPSLPATNPFKTDTIAAAAAAAVVTAASAPAPAREPLADATPPANPMQNASPSCISEPSVSNNYNTCLPPGLPLLPSPESETGHSQASEGKQSSTAPSSSQGLVLGLAGRADDAGSASPSTKSGSPYATVEVHGQAGASPKSDSKGQQVVRAAGGMQAEEVLPLVLEVTRASDSNVSSHAIQPDSPPLSPTAAGLELDVGDLYHEATSDMSQDGAYTEEDSSRAGNIIDWEPLHVTQSVVPASDTSDPTGLTPRYTLGDDGSVTYQYDSDYISRKYEVLTLNVYHRRNRTGFEETKDFPIRLHDLIAGRYQVQDFLGSAAFSRAVQALDIKENVLVCLKIIKNNKDYLDQSLDEIKLLKYVNSHDPQDRYGIVRLYDYFYYKEHLFLVCELLRANLYEFQKYNRESGDAPYFNNARIQRIAYQVLRSLCFLHALGLIHSDLKPENILIKSYSKCEVKVIDLGSSCFVTDQLSSYVQSRSYRAPEVIMGLPYDQKVDIWSLGCILAELSSGQVLFQNDSLATLLARLEGILGPMPGWMVQKGRYASRFYTRSGHLYEKNSATNRYEVLQPKRTSLRHRVPEADEGLLSFIAYLLQVDPAKRPTAAQALRHPWLQAQYPDLG